MGAWRSSPNDSLHVVLRDADAGMLHGGLEEPIVGLRLGCVSYARVSKAVPPNICEVRQRTRLVETIRWPLSVAERALLAVTRSK